MKSKEDIEKLVAKLSPNARVVFGTQTVFVNWTLVELAWGIEHPEAMSIDLEEGMDSNVSIATAEQLARQLMEACWLSNVLKESTTSRLKPGASDVTV